MNTFRTFCVQALSAAALCTVLGTGLALAASAATVNGGNAAGFGYPGQNGQPGDTGRTVNNRTSPRAINDRTEPRQSDDTSTQRDPLQGSTDSLQQERQQGGQEMIQERTGQRP
jgi:hypothetical protein